MNILFLFLFYFFRFVLFCFCFPFSRNNPESFKDISETVNERFNNNSYILNCIQLKLKMQKLLLLFTSEKNFQRMLSSKHPSLPPSKIAAQHYTTMNENHHPNPNNIQYYSQS